MRDERKTKKQLVEELHQARLLIADLENLKNGRKQAEEAVRKSEERFRALIEHSSDGISVVGPDGTVKYAGPANARILGHEPDKVIGGSGFDSIHPDDLPELIGKMEVLIRNPGTVVSSTYRVKHKDGSWRNIETITQNLIEEPLIQGIVTNFRDITDRKQAEDALKKSEELYRNLIETSPTAIVTGDLQGNLTFVNEYLAKMHGYESSYDLLKNMTNIRDLVYSESQQLIEKEFMHLLEFGYSETNEYLLPKKGGGSFPAMVSAAMIKDANGEPAGFLAVAVDITDRKQAEQELLESESNLKLAQEIAHIGNWDWDMQSDIVTWSDEMYRIYGYDSSECVASFKSAWDPIHPDDKNKVGKAIRTAQNKGIPYDIEYRIILPNETERIIRGISRIEKDKSGRVIRMFGTGQDITDQKRAEDILQESEARYATVVKNANDGIAIAYNERIVLTNEALAIITGYSVTELEGKSLLDLMTPESAEYAVGLHRKRMSGESVPSVYQVKALRKDGAIRDLEISAGLIPHRGDVASLAVIRDITERNLVEAALRESEENWRSLVENAPNIILSVNREGIIQFLNRTALPRVDPSELIGKSALDFCMLEYRDIARQALEAVFETGEPMAEMEVLGLKTGDSPIWYSWRGGPVILDGEVVAVTIVATDITSSRQAEELLRESEEKYRTAVDSLSHPLTVYYSDGLVFFMNKVGAGNFGLEPEDVAGKYLHDFFPSTVADIFVERAGLIFDSGEGMEIDDEVPLPSGKRWYHSNLQPMKDSNGEVVAVQTISYDVTERKKAEEALRASEERYRYLAENVTDIIWIMNMDMHLTYISPSVSLMRGYSVEEAMKQSLDEMMSPESVKLSIDTFYQELEMLRKTGINRPVMLEFEQYCKDSSTIWTQSQMTFLQDNDGQPVGILGVTRDISERKLVEEKEKEAERLKELDRLRSELLSNVSHELKTPLTTIKGYATMLLDYDDKLETKEKRQYLQTIDTSSDRMNELVGNLLEMSRMDAGLLKLEKQSCDISHIVRQAVDEAQVRAHDHVIVTDIQKDLPPAEIDPWRIRQIIDNVLDNAVKYSEAGSTVTVQVMRDDTNVIVKIIDQGIGIPADDLQNVFQRMFRAEHGVVMRAGGAGLGLSICQGLVDAHRGRIWIESEEGKGSACIFTLPFG